jgi:predicted hydrocarbon binding protein
MYLNKPEIPLQNRLERNIYLGMEEIIGPNDVRRLLNLETEFHFSDPGLASGQEACSLSKDLSQIQFCLEIEYGSSVGRGLALRSGRASFKHILREFGQELGLTGKDFRLLPLAGRLRIGSELLAKLLNQYTPLNIEQEPGKEYILWNIDYPHECGDLQTNSSACQFMLGILQEAFSWFSGGKNFQVEETQCICRGSSFCSVRIRMKPIQ